MFRRLIMSNFRLYMKCLLSSYTNHTWAVYMGREGVKWARDLVYVKNKYFMHNLKMAIIKRRNT